MSERCALVSAQVCLLMQDEVFKHILWKLVPACIDHLRTKDTDENAQTAPVISTARQQVSSCMYVLCM